jgi:hypothetical protein
MARDTTPERSDINRTVHAPSIIGDPDMAEGTFEVGSLSATDGLLGAPNVNSGFQTLPNPDLPGKLEFTPTFNDGCMYDAAAGHIKDQDFQMTPNPTFNGDSIAGNGSAKGGDVQWDTVAPDTYPEHFPSLYDTHGILGPGIFD